mmetsp:Transcript_207/g.203  ORF Transcript_207/g.203 Transcript_207/m.203 type:complete len:331 (+) Transcript_207:61-1053(+)
MMFVQMKTAFLTVAIFSLLFHVSQTGASQFWLLSPKQHDSYPQRQSRSTSSLFGGHVHFERRLDSHDNSEDENENDDGGGSNGNSNIVWATLDRIDENMNNMWATPPNEWTTEDWEVFGGMFLVAFLCLSCFCFLCCAPICLFEDRDQRKVLTAEQRAANQQKANRNQSATEDKAVGIASIQNDGTKEITKDNNLINENDKDSNDVKTAISSLSAPSYQPSVERRGNLKEPMLNTVASTAEKSTKSRVSHSSRKSSKKQRRSLWSEAVSVWGEFLTDLSYGRDTFAKTDYKEEDGNYQRFEAERKKYVIASPQDKKSRKSVSSKHSGELV